MRVALHITDGPHTGQRILLLPGQSLRIGRTEWADVALAHDPLISGVHFSLECSDGACRLADRNSRNGTFVNGQRVGSHVLSDGDELRAGRSVFSVHIEGAAKEPLSAVAPGGDNGSPRDPPVGIGVETLPDDSPAAAPEVASSPTTEPPPPEPAPGREDRPTEPERGLQLALQAVAGPHTGAKIVLRAGQTATVGRTEWADFVFPEDREMSGVHFALECGGAECIIRDRQSTNGTSLRGQPIDEAELCDGDEIVAGLTRFAVTVEGTPAAAVPALGDTALEQVGPVPLPPELPSASDTVPAEPESPAGVGSAKLILDATGGPHRGQRFVLLAGQTATIGRTEWADYAFPDDAHMSGRHFRLQCTAEACRLCDLESGNGTFLNGSRVTEAVLHNGDEITAGRTVLRVAVECGTVAAGEPSGATAVAAPGAAGMGMYVAALKDDDPGVRRDALLAAAWTAQPWLLPYCRRACSGPAPEQWDAIVLLAILGKPQDLARIRAVGRAVALGPRRYRALGAFGHPGVAPQLLDAMGGPDPAAAVAAAVALAKITGADASSEGTTEIPGGDDEDPDEVRLPDPSLARSQWNAVKDRLPQATRICRGLDLSRGIDATTLAALDMESRYEACLRARFSGHLRLSPIDLEAYGQYTRQIRFD